jgi:DNA-binding transcriptional ArsR family regulator
MVSQMAKYEPGSLDAVFAALADPTRRAMTERLARGDASVSELAAPFDLALPSVTKHLAVLEHAAILEHWKDGRTRYCRLVPAPLDRADAWLGDHLAFWRERFAGLHEHLRRPEP